MPGGSAKEPLTGNEWSNLDENRDFGRKLDFRHPHADTTSRRALGTTKPETRDWRQTRVRTITFGAPTPQARRMVKSGARAEKDFKLSKIPGIHQNSLCPPLRYYSRAGYTERLYESLGK